MEREQLHNQGNLYGYIEQDPQPMNPFEEFEPFGTLVTWHKRYDFGVDGQKEYGEPRDFEKEAEKNKYVVLPVYMYDHSGLTVNTTGFSCQWDSGQLGYIYVTQEFLKAEYGQEDIDSGVAEKQAKNFMRTEIETFDKYLTGDVWGVVIEEKITCKNCRHEEDNHIDSCWGFYGREYAEGECARMFEEAKNREFEPQVKSIVDQLAVGPGGRA